MKSGFLIGTNGFKGTWPAIEYGAWLAGAMKLKVALLGVTEDLYEDGIDRRDPRAPQLALYGWLTWLQGEVVEALASRL